MTDHSRNALVGMCSALREIVTPGVRDDDPLAKQELSMVIRYLEFLTQRVDLLHDRAVVELRTAESLAHGFVEAGSGSGWLDVTLKSARALGASSGASTDAVRRATEELHAATSAALLDAYASGDPGVHGLEQLVLDSATETSLFERAWYAPLGMDHFADDLPPLESLLPGAPDVAGACG